MRLPFNPALLAAALAAFIAADAAVAAPKAMQGKRWRAEDLEKNRPDENYKMPNGFQDGTRSNDHVREEKDAAAFAAAQIDPKRQDDAFKIAAEHATYLQAYQLFFGPYGMSQDENERKKKLKENAAAIEACVKGNGNCSDQDKATVLKALVQHNVGKETQRMALLNRTNAENMKSLNPDAAKIFEAMGKGSSVGNGKRKDANSNYQSATTMDPYFQLDEQKAAVKFSPQELELLGPRFLSDYRGWVKNFVVKNPARHYKYVEAKPNVYVFEPSAPSEKDARIEAEQYQPGIQKLVSDHLDHARPIVAGKPQMIDGKMMSTISGETGTAVGFGDVKDLTVVQAKDKNGNPVAAPGGNTQNGISAQANNADPSKTEIKVYGGYEKFPEYAKNLNKMFKDTAEKSSAERNAASGRLPADQSGASMFQGKTPKEIAETMTPVNITVSPERFNAFLDEIWPTAEGRQKLMNQN